MEEGITCTFYCEDTATNRKKLFKEALSSAKYGKIVYILPEELNELPDLSQDLNSINRHYMKMISFLYVNSLKDLIESVTTLSEWEHVPSTVILDSLNEYCSKKDIQNACGVVALLVDTTRSCSAALNTPTKLYVSITKDVAGDDYCHSLLHLYATN